MTTPSQSVTAGPPESRARRVVGIMLAVLFSFSLFVSATLLWTDHFVFNSQRFAARADAVLDSAEVRSVLADQITSAAVAAGSSEVASFRAVIKPTVEVMIGTPVFRRIFRDALRQAHDYMFTRKGNDAVVNMSQALGILTSSLQLTNPSVASLLPESTDTFLVDLGHRVKGLQLWRISSRVSDFGWLASALTILLGIATVRIERDRRRSTFRLGIAVAVSGALVFATALVIETIAGSYGSSPEMQNAIAAAASTFLADYRIIGLGLVAIGIATAAFATASAPTHAPTTLRGIVEHSRARIRHLVPDTQRTRTLAALGLMAAGGAVLVWRDAFIELLVLAVGAVLLYLGAARLLAIVGRVGVAPAAAVAHHPTRTWHPRFWRMVAGTIGGLVVIVVIAVWATGNARARAVGNDQRMCNGSASLCGKRLDEVVFAGSHNSMSVASDPGWLFFEQDRSIPAQLDSGIRALLVKTHYGIPTTIRVTGANLVVTDKSAELFADATSGDVPLSPAQQAALDQSTAATRNLDPGLRDVYLCHVNCEFGATRFTTALGYVRQFLNRNPDEVVILFVGNYVSDADTEKAFRDARLLDRLWRYDPAAPMPTLAELIDSGHNVIYLAEFTSAFDAARPWNVPGYGITQDNPYTYRTTQDLLTPGAPGYTGSARVTGPVPDTTIPAGGGAPVFSKDWTGLPSCAPNRGSPESPLFQINHWVTPAGAPPTVDQARIVNARNVLLPAVRNCMTQRARFPTIVGVNFAEVGDLFQVVNELNGVK